MPDFIAKLRAIPRHLEILGDGSQTKSYLHITDCVSAINLAASLSKGVSIFNVGTEDQIDVRSIADIVCEEMRLRPRYHFTGGVNGRGWQGDVKNMLLGVGKLKSLGWKPKFGSAEAVRLTAKQIISFTPQ